MNETKATSGEQQTKTNKLKLAQLKYKRERCAQCLEHARLILQKLPTSITFFSKQSPNNYLQHNHAQASKPEISIPKTQSQPIPRALLPMSSQPHQSSNGAVSQAPGRSVPAASVNNASKPAASHKAPSAKAPSIQSETRNPHSHSAPNERENHEETRENRAYLLMQKKVAQMEQCLKAFDKEISQLKKEQENNVSLQQYVYQHNVNSTHG